MLEESVSSSSPTFWAGLYSWFTPTVFFLLLQLVIATIYITSSLANATHKRHHQPHEQDPQQATNFQQQHHQQHQQQQQLFRSPSVLQRLKSINLYSYPYRSQDAPHTPPQPQLQTHENENPQLARSPSSVLQRLKSINLYSYLPTEPFSHILTPNTTVSSTEKTHEPEKRHVAVMEKEEEEEEENEKEDEEEEEEEDDDDDVLGQIRDNLGGYEEVGKGEGKFSSLDEVFRQLQGQGGNFSRTNSDTKPASGEIPVKLSKKMKKSASSKSAFGHFKEEDIVESRRPATVRESKVAAAAADDNEVDAKADDFINKFKQQLKLQRLDSIIRYKDMINRGA